MKVKIFLVFLILYSLHSQLFGQSNNSKMYQRNFIWVTPVNKNTTINGVALGLLGAFTYKGTDTLKINGLNLDASLGGLLGTIYAFTGSIFAPFYNKEKWKSGGEDIASIKIYTDTSSPIRVVIRGVSLSFGGLLRDTKINGASLNGGISFAQELNGLEITGVMNLHYEFTGVMIAGLRNKATKGKGVQIGLFNNCKEGQVFQIGLLNRIGKRVLPICNFSFKRKMKNKKKPSTKK